MQKIMWKLNKSIAKELLPTQPVDFAIEPWWGVCLVNFTLEEFKVRILVTQVINIIHSVTFVIRQKTYFYVSLCMHFQVTICVIDVSLP